MTTHENEGWRPVKLSAKVFGHISLGLYRSPAGAIKELISNAFDADAHMVRIQTGFPRFDSFSCEDTGTGLSRKDFDRLMRMGLGTSEKPLLANQRTPELDRPVIGRLGIGLLSLAHICTQFDFISHCSRTKEAFKVTLRFPQYARQKIDEQELPDDTGYVEGGEYRIQDLQFNPKIAGVKIHTKYLRESFRKRLMNLERLRNFQKFKTRGPYKSFDHFMEAIYQSKDKLTALSTAADYDQLIFALALIPPLPYWSDAGTNVALALPLMVNYQQRLMQNNFSVTVDNLRLSRPLRLPSDKDRTAAKRCTIGGVSPEKFKLVDGDHEEEVAVQKHQIRVKGSDIQFSAYELSYQREKVGGRPLRFWGYLFQQTGRLYPRDIQGVIVRIKDVAIGTYDTSLMLYPLGEGPRYSMISGEFIVEEGFDDALNIDRDSFNTLDPHYLRVQAYLHCFLHTVFFSEAWTEEKARNKKRREEAKHERQRKFVHILKAHSKGKYSRIETIEPDDPTSYEAITLVPSKRRVLLNLKHPLLERVLSRHKYEDLAQQISIAFEHALSKGGKEATRENFYRLLADIFDNQP